MRGVRVVMSLCHDVIAIKKGARETNNKGKTKPSSLSERINFGGARGAVYVSYISKVLSPQQ